MLTYKIDIIYYTILIFDFIIFFPPSQLNHYMN